MNTAVSHVRKPWIATSLSLVCTGLGQIYCGRAGRGLMMYSGSLLFGPIIIATALAANSTPMLVAFLASLAGLVGLFIWSVRDARAIARRMATTSFQPQEFNRPLVYGMLAMTNLPYVIGLAFFLRATAFEAFVIPTASMTPTLVPGDRILVTKIGLDAQTIQRGEVVVFRNPINRRQNFVKRIIGLPGETVEIKNGEVFINGERLERTAVPPAEDGAENKGPEGCQTFLERAGDRQYRIRLDKPESPLQLPPQVVAADAYFVLGDHRDLSLDSREFGNVPHGLMVGIVKYLYYPGDTWNRFGCSISSARPADR